MKFANIDQTISRAVSICLSVLWILCSAGLCGMLGGCIIGPKYQRPAVAVAPAYKELGNWQPAEPKDTIVRGQWWEVFQDPQLNDLERRVDRGNQTIAAAAANYEAARALVREARAQYFPTLQRARRLQMPESPRSRSRESTLRATNITNRSSLHRLLGTGPLGRIRNNVRANAYAAQGSAADLENARLLTEANLAADYFDLRGVEEQKRLFDATVIAWSKYLDLTRGLLKAASMPMKPWRRLSRSSKQHRLRRRILALREPNMNTPLPFCSENRLPRFRLRPIEGCASPVHSLRHPASFWRDDRILPRRSGRWPAGTLQIGIAKAAYFPNVVLGATGGFESLTFADWFTWPSRFWSVGPAAAETLFDAGLRKATVRQYQAQYDETVANYRQTVLAAFGQVEDNLAGLRILAQDLQQQEAAVESAQRYVKQATARNLSGLDPYLNVLTAQVDLLTYQQTYVTFQTQQMLDTVQLIEALGGGWDTSQLPTPKDLRSETHRGAPDVTSVTHSMCLASPQLDKLGLKMNIN